MSVVRDARALGARIEVADFGVWSGAALLAEYDARSRTIRINRRSLQALCVKSRRRFLVRAIAHELYHHLEALGAVECASTRRERERNAERFAQATLP